MNWKDEFRGKWNLYKEETYKIIRGGSIGEENTFTTCTEDVIDDIESLLKEQREEVVRNIQMGFGVGTIEEYQINIIKKNGLNAKEPSGVKK